ncbi:MAG: polyprenyl synthetase family protein, partial [Kiritimatiellae bacterium]|nr:polyprenyl synthetase family protein [Kiritimatiellia bacterium]
MSPAAAEESLKTRLDQVRRLMAEVLAETVLGRLAGDGRALVGSGKMLRARLLLRIAEVRKTPRPAWLSAAAAVEMIHAASLLHDDVIDGGIIRRHLPAFWKQRGIAGAILAGD